MVLRGNRKKQVGDTSRSVEGSIVSIDGSKLIVSLKTDLGSFLKKGVLVIDADSLGGIGRFPMGGS